LAKAWLPEPGDPSPPVELEALLMTAGTFGTITFDVGYPELRVRFDRVRGEPRNTDLAIGAQALVGPIAISVEAKADESFGRTLGQEVVEAAADWSFEERPGKLERLQGLVRAIIPARSPDQAALGSLRYQLLTATAGAWTFAAQRGAAIAILVVHEFLGPRINAARLRANADDLDAFMDRVTGGAHPSLAHDELVGPLPVPPSDMWVGVTEWYLGKCRRDLP